MKTIWLLAWLLLSATLAHAQGEEPSIEPVEFGDLVEDTITEDAFFDWWQVEAVAGDVMIAEMTASDGLEPLLGVLDPGGNLVMTSADGAPNGLVEIEYRVETPGEYTLVATRVGNEDGTSTGSYALILGLARVGEARITPYEQVEFRCADFEVTTAASLRFRQPGRAQQILVYGLDGFQPVIRLLNERAEAANVCTRDGSGTGDVIALPGTTRMTIDGETAQVAKATLEPAADARPDRITLTIGSVDGTPGRYLAVVTGFSLDDGDDVDSIEARLGPLAAQGSSLLVYMIDAEHNGRLDPFLRFGTDPNEGGCDDAGRRGCETIPEVIDVGVTTVDGLRLLGDRFDAGLRIPEGELDSVGMVLSSFDNNTRGPYALLLIGELPPRPTATE